MMFNSIEGEIPTHHQNLKIGDDYYWNYRINRLMELKKYIEEHHNIDYMSKDPVGSKIYTAFIKRGEFLEDAIEELGYNFRDIKKYLSNGYYNDFSKIEKRIASFINEHKRFPSQKEIIKELFIDQRYIDKFGGIDSIKNKIGYQDDSDLIDSNGFKNKSNYEYIVAQFLFKNNISYKRDVSPFPKNKRYKSDFTLYLEDKEIHIEVWGYKKDTGNFSDRYNKKKQIKIALYKKYSLPLVSIEGYKLDNITYKHADEYLSECFGELLNLDFYNVENDVYLKITDLTDDELFNEIMVFSDNLVYFPKYETLIDSGKYYLYNEVLKRYNKYHIFARKYNKKTFGRNFSKEDFTKEYIFEQFSIILEIYNKGINKHSICNDLKNYTLYDIATKQYGILYIKLEFFQQYIDESKKLPKTELLWLNNIVNNKRMHIKSNKIKPEHQLLAKQILDKYNSYMKPDNQ